MGEGRGRAEREAEGIAACSRKGSCSRKVAASEGGRGVGEGGDV
jgi:hypothetical protein